MSISMVCHFVPVVAAYCQNRNSEKYVFIVQDRAGGEATWLEEVRAPDHPLGSGCKICRWHGEGEVFKRAEVCGDNAVTLSKLRRHGGACGAPPGKAGIRSSGHACAQSTLLMREPSPAPVQEDRFDLP